MANTEAGAGLRVPGLDPQAVAAVRTLDDLAGLLRHLRRRHARQQRDSELTYRELAAKTGWSQAALGEYFTGKTLPPTDRFDALVRLLGATPAEQGALATARDRVHEARRAPRPPPGAATAGPPTTPVPRQLPKDVYGFAGRAAPLAELDAMLVKAEQFPTVVISALSGTAGVGKTALALHWAHRVAPRFPDGQLYVNLRGFDPAGSVVTPDEALRDFLDAFGVPPERIPAQLPALAALYRSILADRQVLVVLDNARDAEQIRPLLPGAPGCLVLVTSRDSLSGLVTAQGARPVVLDVLPPAEAWELLACRLGAQRVAAEPSAVDDIITRCAGLPLALAIVATRAAVSPASTLDGIAGELRAAAGGLEPFADTDPAVDIRSVFSWSYDALGPAAARMFRFLALHPGPDVSPEAAASLVGVPRPRAREQLRELLHGHLVTETAPGRYTLHDLLRAYAVERTLVADPRADRDEAVRRMLDHYLHTAHRADLRLYPHRDPVPMPAPRPGTEPEAPVDRSAALAWFTTERPVLLAAVRCAGEHRLDTRAWHLAWSMVTYLDYRGHWSELVETQRMAVAAAQRSDDPGKRLRAHWNLANACSQLGRDKEAHAHYRDALRLSRATGDRIAEADTHGALARLRERAGDLTGAVRHAERALRLCRTAGDPHRLAIALNNAGWYRSRAGDRRGALDLCRQALARHEDSGDRLGQAHAWDSLGHIHHHLGEQEQAERSYRQAVAAFREAENGLGEAETLSRLGELRLAAGRTGPARHAWDRALAIFTELGHPAAAEVRARLRDLDAAAP